MAKAFDRKAPGPQSPEEAIPGLDIEEPAGSGTAPEPGVGPVAPVKAAEEKTTPVGVDPPARLAMQKIVPLDDLRERAAVQVLASLMQYYHSVDDNTIDHAARMAWLCADALVASRDLPPEKLKPRREVTPTYDLDEAVEEAEARPQPAHPADEWWVYDGVESPDNPPYKGFVTEAAAWTFAVDRPGARVVKVAGPGARTFVAT